ncbi:MAG TPA: sigma-70 family RNA polymerase sigma factor [Planctomycetota bacterium]|nr:sigma-70 family RNA polymerase sigma factor [Planctomycetota bacterium]
MPGNMPVAADRPETPTPGDPPGNVGATGPAPGGPAEGTRAPGAGQDVEDVRLAAAGSREAFDRLVLRHQDAVVNAATYYLGNYDDAVDVAQDAFLKAYRALGEFRGSASFRTWILRVALNTARSLRARGRARKRAARVVTPSQAGPPGSRGEEGHGLDVADPDTSGAPATLLERKEVKAALEAAIAGLDEESREVIVLRDIAGETYEAIAAQLGIALGTVKSRVHRARLVLREKLVRYL